MERRLGVNIITAGKLQSTETLGLMKNASLAAVTALLIALLISTIPVSVVDANPYSFKPEKPGLYVYHPNSNHVTVIDPTLDILFYYAMEDNLTQISFSYTLDNGAHIPLSATLKNSNYVYYYTVASSLNNLPDGKHEFTVYAHSSNGTINAIIQTVITVDAVANVPIIFSPLNQTTYNTTQVPLVYAINKEILWSYYSLDSTNSSDLKNFDGNITLDSLSEGRHELTLAVTTNASTPHQTIQTIIFSVNTAAVPSSVPEYSIMVLLAAFLAVVSVMLIVGKRKLTVGYMR